MVPNSGQLVLVILAVVLFGAAEVISVARLGKNLASVGFWSMICLVVGLLMLIGVLIWHSISSGQWRPIGDNFSAMVWLGTLLGMFVVYARCTLLLGALHWFVMPVAILMLLAGAYFGSVNPQRYVSSVWLCVHYFSAYAGAIAFAIAAAAGCMYMLTSRVLRAKAPMGPHFSSLERLERLTLSAVTLGFSLLTIGMITGIVWLFEGKHTSHAKVILAVCVWVVYGVVLHSPINPRFRGRKAAILSIIGFLLMIGTLVAVQLMPGIA
jgi:ABC-type uncharacterized transport system permease subunit